jgi:hypothetical protein
MSRKNKSKKNSASNGTQAGNTTPVYKGSIYMPRQVADQIFVKEYLAHPIQMWEITNDKSGDVVVYSLAFDLEDAVAKAHNSVKLLETYTVRKAQQNTPITTPTPSYNPERQKFIESILARNDLNAEQKTSIISKI